MVYSLDSELKDKEISVFLHGNASKRTHPYIRTSGETMEKLWDNLYPGKSVTGAYDLFLEELRGPLKSAPQSQQPRYKKKVQIL